MKAITYVISAPSESFCDERIKTLIAAFGLTDSVALFAAFKAFQRDILGSLYVVPAEAVAPAPKQCSGDGIGNTTCAAPKHRTTQSGRTYMDWACENCGGKGRSTWD